MYNDQLVLSIIAVLLAMYQITDAAPHVKRKRQVVVPEERFHRFCHILFILPIAISRCKTEEEKFKRLCQNNSTGILPENLFFCSNL